MTASRRPLLVAAVYLGTFIAVLDVSIVNVALPTLQRALETDLAGLQWVVDSYTLCLSAFMLSAGAISDRYGRKRSWLIGVGVFTLGSAICAAAPNLAVLLAGRVVQGVAGALLIPGALSILVQAFPDARERSHVIGGWSSFTALSLIVGPILGGTLVDLVGWQSIFLINLPLGVIAMLLGAGSMEETAHPEHAALDPGGQLLSIVWLGALTFALIEAGEAGWSAPLTLAALTVGIVGLAAFLTVEARARKPMLPLSFFRDASFTVTNMASFTLGFASYSSVFFFSLFFQQVQGMSPVMAGLHMSPQFIAQVLVAPLSGRLTARFGHRAVMIVGYLLFGGAMLAMFRVGAETSYACFGALLAVMGIGTGLAIPTTSAAAMLSVPRERSGMASAIVNATRQTGTAIGIALLGALMSQRAMSLLTDSLDLAGVAGAADVAHAAVSRHEFAANAALGEGGVQALFVDAYAGGFQAAMLVAGAVVLCAAVLLLAVRPRAQPAFVQ